ncbi:nucleotidyltransferase domain-containing protein [Halobacillus rhizosphaerae]|uniref:nucleotidyltransferase domain-containing protein n=1 Tax=Halobacillus rhizosphaerae TaxID=3064889 RepID=UPI00398B7039
MTDIKEIGFMCTINDQGIIVNESSIDKIDSKYKKAIDYVLESILKSFSSKIHSIYVRGSLPRGLGIKGVSDLDLLVVTQTPLNNKELLELQELENNGVHHFPFINGLEIGLYPLEDVVKTSHFHIIPFMIKTFSVCLYGDNLQTLLPEFKADEKLANEHIVNIASQLQQAKDDLIGNNDEEDIKGCCTWIMKIIIRCGLALVLMKENTYTRDLYPAYNLFSKHFPEKQEEMKSAINYAINPSVNNKEILSFLRSFGEWIVNQSDDWLEDYNPQRLKQLPL